MEFTAKARFIKCSPCKLRPLANVIRGKDVCSALDWLFVYNTLRSSVLKKIFVKEVKIDQGPIHRYFKPGAMGRSNAYRKRLSHMSVILAKRRI